MSCGRIPHGTITHPTPPTLHLFNLSRLSAGGASPRGRSAGSTDASPPSEPKRGGPVRAGASPCGARVGCGPDSVCAPTNSPSAPLKVPTLPPPTPASCPPTRKRGGEGDVVARASVHDSNDFFSLFYFPKYIFMCVIYI